MHFNKNTLTSYSWVTGEKLGVEHTHIAFSGIWLVDHCGSATDIGMEVQFFKEKTLSYPDSPDWDFQRYQPHIVVINLGTNDTTRVSETTFQATYISFLQKIRQKYPTPTIVVLETFLGLLSTPTQQAVQAVMNEGDRNVHYVATSDWITPNTSD